MLVLPRSGLEGLRDLGFEEASPAELCLDVVARDRGTAEVTGARLALGTRVAVTALAGSSAQAETAIAAAFAELDRLSAVFSRYDPTTPLSLLNDAGHLEGPPPELIHVVAHAMALSAASGGAFDVTVKPVMDLLGSGTVAEDAKRRAVRLIGARRIAVDRRGIRFGRGGMGLTLDGIAKGYIVDRMADVLDRHGVGRFLIDGGGDIRVRGLNGRKRPWTIAVRDPRGGERHPEVIGLAAGAVATSGGYARFLDGARTIPHIVTPATGDTPRAVASASVVAGDASTADALSTAVFVLGAHAGLSLIDALPGCAAFVLDAAGRAFRSNRWTALAARSHEGPLA
jgi:thiamine biosynthesis lipoprotein